MSVKIAATSLILGLAAVSVNATADPIIYETFTGYPEDALISADPAGPAIGLTGNWTLDPDNFFYVNMTGDDPDAGTGKAVYDMPYDDNGARTAQRSASQNPVLLDSDGGVFYASFLIHPARADGGMLFTLTLDRIDGGGQPELSFGMHDGNFVVGNGGVNVDVVGGAPTVSEMQVVLRLEYGDGGPDDPEVVTLWVDPADETSTPVIDNVAADLLNRGGARIVGVAIRGEQMAGQPAMFDDLLVGYEFEDVVGNPPADFLAHDPGMNGLFYDPGNPGHGLNFVVHAGGMTILYYGHSATGERLWLISGTFEGDLEFNEPIEMDMYEVLSGTFGAPQTPPTVWGNITISLADCNAGRASFSGLDGTLDMDFVRLTYIPSVSCK